MIVVVGAGQVRGDPLGGPFTVLLHRDGRLTGAQSVDDPRGFLAARRALSQTGGT
jgi:hypothetical protein